MTKKKKLISLIAFFCVIFLIFIITSIIPKNYAYKYKVGKIEVVEKYDVDKKSYLFSFTSDDVVFEYSQPSKYIRKRGLIQNAKIKDSCLTIESNDIIETTLCKEGNNYYTNYYSNDVSGDIIESFENINIYNLLDKKYFIWNYTAFLAVDQAEKEKITLFEKDIYELNLITKIKDYLVVADYDQEYYFDKMYLIKTKNNKVSEVKLDRNIYFNSYILGTYKKDIYLYDLQKEQEYRINPFKEKVLKNSYEILVNNKWKKTSTNKLNKKELYFHNESDYGYYLEGDLLYYRLLNSKVLITDMEVSNIVESYETKAYFISEDSLYCVDFYTGVTKIMSYSEWKFNSKNIYIF